ncbi:hypothetical protein GGTG_14137 [Gaeumannomyces tritici R3-111a-1]|uniref:Uncharacterized protein n=1 Tax=Gaeumannomyces tritici (strain R3-111a-1) TaxID=644352 RepID=J3PKS0_GAET3|nr:hypothetical protein GGTG_14137 [Gaeumannomyces tritici R3-111a-1]EJT68281.1 hypothetical protein GGTG_14137 [Gaeumannomyces tritici R3-111a-1]
MDALKNLSANIPDWVRRLEELSGQIEQRQIELAKFAEANSPSPAGDSRSMHSIKSLRNKGSTESLRPTDEPADGDPIPESEDAGITPTPSPGPAASDVTPTPTTVAARAQTQATPSPPVVAEPPTTTTTTTTTMTTTATATSTPALLSPQPLSNGISQQKQASDTELMEATRARARALVRKRIRSDSVVSGDGAAVAYRSKNMVLVYYDSYVQGFFEELVKFVSGSRNLMRKAKMAAKVAHIKRMAELEMSGYSDDEGGGSDELKVDDDGPMLAADPAAQKREGDGDDGGEDEELPPLKYVSTRQMHVRSRLGPGGAAMLRPSGLEFVQSTCERAAHQFLRDGDCGGEIAKIKARLAQTGGLASAELERKLREGPSPEDLALQEVATKGRSYRLPSMRREAVKKPALGAATPTPPALSPSPSTSPAPSPAPAPAPLDMGGNLAVDESVEDDEEEVMPKLVYKSTRRMMRGDVY